MPCFCTSDVECHVSVSSISLNLTVNFFSSKNTKFTAGCPSLPSQMKTVVCAMEDLQCNTEGPSSEDDDFSQ
jgi:structure-specific endonuclease subunit SLX1